MHHWNISHVFLAIHTDAFCRRYGIRHPHYKIPPRIGNTVFCSKIWVRHEAGRRLAHFEKSI